MLLRRVVEVESSNELASSSFVKCRRHQVRGLVGPILSWENG